MSGMVDRVARAIAQAQHVAIAEAVSSPPELRELYRGMARAALEVVRDAAPPDSEVWRTMNAALQD